MSTDGVKRKLTSILAADVQGYSRLIEANDEETVKRLKAYREIIDGLIARHDGRIEGTAGDSVIAEFASAVEAVRCAVAIQEEIEARNADVPADQVVRFRIGISIGDVIADGDELHGDGVNIAARLEALADAGGICISASAVDQVRNKVAVSFEDLGPLKVKNIAEPIQTYRVVRPKAAAAPAGATAISHAKRWKVYGMSAAASIAVVVAGVVVWQLYLGPTPAAARPSIAILPFTNMSGDSNQEYFSDGLTEDLITNLAQFHNLSVIARHSVFTFKGKSASIGKISSDLGARYVVEGSVRRDKGALRITAQLTDSSSGSHLWAARYDRPVGDIFKVQDEISNTIARKLLKNVSLRPVASIRACATEIEAAYLMYSLARFHHYRTKPQDNTEAIELLNKAIEIDKSYASAYVLLAAAYGKSLRFGWTDKDRKTVGKERMAAAITAIKARPNCGMGYRALARAQVGNKATQEIAEENANTALRLDPGDPETYGILGRLHLYRGEYKQAIDRFQEALRIDPKAYRFNVLSGVTAFYDGKYEQAREFLERATSGRRAGSKAIIAHAHLAAIYFRLGEVNKEKDPDKAAGYIKKSDEMKAKVMKDLRWFKVGRFTKLISRPFKDHKPVMGLGDAMIKAGLPRE